MHLWHAAKDNDLEAAKKILSVSQGRVSYSSGCMDTTPLSWAIYNANIEMAQLLLDNGARESINQPDTDGYPPLYWAACYADIEMAQLLLDNGAQVTQKSINIAEGDMGAFLNSYERVRHLWHASKDNDLSAAKKILAVSEGGVAYTADCIGTTPLSWAIYNANIEMAQLLLDSGARKKINQPDADGFPSLYWAVRYANIEMAQLLLDNGAQVTQKSMNIAGGDMRGLLERHIRLKAQGDVNACLLNVQRKAGTIADNPDHALYDSLALLTGPIPILIFSMLNKPYTDDENQEGVNARRQGSSNRT